MKDRAESGELISERPIKENVEPALDVAGLVGLFNCRNPPGRFDLRHGPLGVLQKRGDERVADDVQRFVEIGASVVRRDAGAETNAILRHRGIIDRRYPKPPATQLVTK